MVINPALISGSLITMVFSKFSRFLSFSEDLFYERGKLKEEKEAFEKNEALGFIILRTKETKNLLHM